MEGHILNLWDKCKWNKLCLIISCQIIFDLYIHCISHSILEEYGFWYSITLWESSWNLELFKEIFLICTSELVWRRSVFIYASSTTLAPLGMSVAYTEISMCRRGIGTGTVTSSWLRSVHVLALCYWEHKKTQTAATASSVVRLEPPCISSMWSSRTHVASPPIPTNIKAHSVQRACNLLCGIRRFLILNCTAA